MMKFFQLVLLVLTALCSSSNNMFLLVSAQEEEAAAVPNCDELCASQVAEATRVAQQQLAALQGELEPLKAMLEQSKKDSLAATGQIQTLQEQIAAMEQSVQEAKSLAAASQQEAAESQAAKADAVKAVTAELELTQQKLAEYEQAPFLFNVEAIKSMVQKLLQKYGLGGKQEL
eukprot:Nitzschia sp. Nitz4//scaffold181_size46380//30239//30760//NITZ4_007180-RA/size46380-processed-gene-0.27-mRNA-1//1//CDS//3329539519//7721//frame0